jgi:hypothetical protein
MNRVFVKRGKRTLRRSALRSPDRAGVESRFAHTHFPRRFLCCCNTEIISCSVRNVRGRFVASVPAELRCPHTRHVERSGNFSMGGTVCIVEIAKSEPKRKDNL